MSLSSFGKYGRAASKLADAVKAGVVPHAYIIEGDHNVDKEGFAKEFFKALICRQAPGEGCGRCADCRKIEAENFPDLFIVRPEDTTKSGSGTTTVKDAQIEQLQVDLKTKPTAGEHNMAIVTGADTMTVRAMTRFLKTLEEPPAGTVIMLLSENSEELLPTIRSRCVEERLYDLGSGEKNEMTDLAGRIIGMLKEKAYFSDMKNELDENIKTRNDAYRLIDAIEAKVGEKARAAKAGRAGSKMKNVVSKIEDTRRDIKAGASYNYMLRSLILELEELI